MLSMESKAEKLFSLSFLQLRLLFRMKANFAAILLLPVFAGAAFSLIGETISAGYGLLFMLLISACILANASNRARRFLLLTANGKFNFINAWVALSGIIIMIPQIAVYLFVTSLFGASVPLWITTLALFIGLGLNSMLAAVGSSY